MGKNLQLISILLLLTISGTFASTKSFNCTKILKEDKDYPISLVDKCSQKLEAEIRSCPKLKCNKFCIFGEIIEENGCPTCACKQTDMFEGDIVLLEPVKSYITNNYVNPNRIIDPTKARGATRSLPLWKMYPSGDKYIVPFVISSSIGSRGRSAIQSAAADFSRYSCIRLQPRRSQNRYIEFYRGGGCSSPVGAVSNRQYVSLASGCWDKGTVIHEVLHSLGFWHEQSRPDRDSYVRILTQNIIQGMGYNFNKFSTSSVNSMGSAYDIGSVMHYNSYAFSSNGRPTITDLSGRPIRTQRNGFSQSDIKQLNDLYGCKTTGGGGGGGNNCVDSNSNCASWASRNECTKNPGYMLKNCCKSCKTTTVITTTKAPPTPKPTTKPSCKNNNQFCASWASRGECRRNPDYMLIQCCKSCNSNCKDRNRNCYSWSIAGYCNTRQYATYMRSNCQKSCRLC